MKNYNEMANDVFRRIGEHETLKRNRRKVMKKVIIPICCFCLISLLGIGLWHGNFFDNTKPIELEDSTIIGGRGYIGPDANNQSNGKGDVIGMVKYGGVYYVQCTKGSKVYTPEKYLGEANDFEGTYQTYLSDSAGGLYLTKEDSNVLMVELKNGEYVILIKEQDQTKFYEKSFCSP